MTREEAIEVLQASSIKQMSLTKIIVNGKALSVKTALEMAIQALEQLTSYEQTINKLTKAISEQEPKTGRWIEHFDDSGKWYECDQCHTDWGGPVNYCPNCGAKMESEVSE